LPFISGEDMCNPLKTIPSAQEAFASTRKTKERIDMKSKERKKLKASEYPEQ
jgi:hypothetical protein